jgi:hypothetical protein
MFNCSIQTVGPDLQSQPTSHVLRRMYIQRLQTAGLDNMSKLHHVPRNQQRPVQAEPSMHREAAS